MDYSLTNRSFQFMLFQNKAYHEERLAQPKPTLDTKMNDYSHIFNPKNPSRKQYLAREKQRQIYYENAHLLNKIHAISYEKSIKFPSVERPRTYNYDLAKLSKRDNHSNIPSMNIKIREKESERIKDNNDMLSMKLKNTKPTICIEDFKKHATEMKKISKRLRSYDQHNRPRIIFHILDRNKLSSVLNKFIDKHGIYYSPKVSSTGTSADTASGNISRSYNQNFKRSKSRNTTKNKDQLHTNKHSNERILNEKSLTPKSISKDIISKIENTSFIDSIDSPDHERSSFNTKPRKVMTENKKTEEEDVGSHPMWYSHFKKKKIDRSNSHLETMELLKKNQVATKKLKNFTEENNTTFISVNNNTKRQLKKSNSIDDTDDYKFDQIDDIIDACKTYYKQ